MVVAVAVGVDERRASACRLLVRLVEALEWPWGSQSSREAKFVIRRWVSSGRGRRWPRLAAATGDGNWLACDGVVARALDGGS